MSETQQPLMRSTVDVEITGGPDKVVRFPLEEQPAVMGMHGELAEFFGAAPDSFTPRPSTLDYVIGAVGGCLAGTLKRALAARGLPPAPDALKTTATGEIVVVDGVPVLRRIEVAYELSGVAEEDRETAERAHSVHHRGCAVSRSVEAAIDIRSTLTLV